MKSSAKSLRGLPTRKTDSGGQSNVSSKEEVTFRGIPKDFADVTLAVEGRELRVSRAVLAHYSPVFHRMFFSGFKESTKDSVPLPDESFQDMTLFVNVLLPRTLCRGETINDENLLQLLTLADKYDTEEVKVRCQEYMSSCVASHFHNFYDHYTTDRRTRHSRSPISRGSLEGQSLSKDDLLDRLCLYLRACDAFRLPGDKTMIDLYLNVCDSKRDLCYSEHYQHLSAEMKVELLETMCGRLEENQRKSSWYSDGSNSSSDSQC